MAASTGSYPVRAWWNVPWLTDRRLWAESLASALWLLAAGTVWWLADRLSVAQQVLAVGVLLAVLAWLLRGGWVRLFGPVLFYDLVRLARRNRYFIIRCAYAVGLLLMLYWVHEQFAAQMRLNAMLYRGTIGMAPWMATNPPGREMAEFAEWFFYTVMVVQFAAVLLLTPAYAAGAVAEEKDRKTLEFLFATDLSNREIVLSKLAARGFNMALIVLTGLPILSLTQFLGGVDPNLVLAGFAATGLTLVSLAAFSILCSVYVRKPRDAILLTYLGVGTYLALASLLHQTPALAGPVVDVLNAGNLYAALAGLADDVNSGKDLAASIPAVLRNYAIFHGAVAVVCATWAILRLRAVGLQQTAGPVRRTSPAVGRSGRRRIGLLPMVWKELYNEPGFRLNWMGWCVVAFFVIASLAPAGWVAAAFLEEALFSAPTYHAGGAGYALAKELNPWVGYAGSAAACLLLVGVAVRASSSVSGERDRETLDALLTTPLESHDILFAKWLGSLLSVRWGYLWLALIWGLGLVTGALYFGSFVLLLIAWLTYASTLAGVGLWYSTANPSTQRASLATLVASAGVFGAPWLLVLFCGPEGHELLGWLSPPTVLYWLACTEETFQQNEVRTLVCLFGLFAWALVAVFLWSITRTRFRKISSRMPYRRPDPLPLANVEYRRLLGQER